MFDPERIRSLAEKLGNREDALEYVRQLRCGGRKYDGGGKFFRTNLENESPLAYQPMMPIYHDLVPPLRFRPEPDRGDYEPPVSTGMMRDMPISRVYSPVVPETGVLMDEMERPSVIDLFSDEAKVRRALKQRYAESAFDDRAVSNAGARGAWQIMPITLKDYLGRGRGKSGDLNDPEYNRKVRDWVMGIIPRDLKEFWSESDSDRAKLAKLYAAYNWGAGNLRSFLRKKRDAGVDISNPDNWVNDLNPETRRYVKYLAFDEDIPDSIYTNSAFEDAARKRGYMASGGKIHIKPENRGKFTALKKRTGHSASWFKAHGTPAQKKMAVFALNAKKWKHENGGYMNRYDGETEETGWLRRLLNTPTMVPNMTGTATAAAAGLRDIPLTQSTVGDELAVAGAALASPFVMSAPQFAGNAINWISNPANQILAAKLAVPLLGGAAVEEGVRSYTPYSGVGNFLYNAPVVPGSSWSPAYSQARRGTPQWARNLTEGLLGFANPGYFVSPELMAPAMDKVMREYAKDFATHVKEPVKRGAEYAKDWYDFVVKKNTQPYIGAINDLFDMKAKEEGMESSIKALEKVLQEGNFYELPVWRKVEDVAGGSTESLLSHFPTEGLVRSGATGDVTVPYLLADLGEDGAAPFSSRITYLTAKPDDAIAPYLTYRFNQQDPIGIYISGRNGEKRYTSSLTGKIHHRASAVSPGPARGSFVMPYELGKGPAVQYRTEMESKPFLPVQRGDAGQAQMYDTIVRDVDNMMQGKATTTGSFQLYRGKMLSGEAHDIELLCPEENLVDVEKMIGFRKRKGDNGFAIQGESKLLPQYETDPFSGNVDIQVVRKNNNGNASGEVAWGMFKTMHPEEFALQAEESIVQKVPYTEMEIINPSTGIPYTPLELYNEFVSGDYQMQHVVNEALGMHRQYYGNDRFLPIGSKESIAEDAKKLLKQNRPISILTNHDESVKAMVRKALDTNAYSACGPEYIHGSEYFPNLDFADVASNKRFLKDMHIKDDGLSSDPELMRNLFDAWYLGRTTRYRVVSGMPGKSGATRGVHTSNIAYVNGDYAGSGRNTVRGTFSGAPMDAHDAGMSQINPSYRESVPEVRTYDDVNALFRRLDATNKNPYVFTAEEEQIVNDALVTKLNEISTSSKYDAATRKAAQDMLMDIRKTPVKGLRRLDDMFRKKSSQYVSKMQNEAAEELIDYVSVTADIPEVATSNYDSYYHGIWKKDAPSARTIRRRSDVYGKEQPYEVGRDIWRYAIGKQGKVTTNSVARNMLSADDANLQELLMDADPMGGWGGMSFSGRQLESIGAKLGENTDINAELLRNKLSEIEGMQSVAEDKLGLLRRYYNMPGSRRVIRPAERDAGVGYRPKSARGEERFFRTLPKDYLQFPQSAVDSASEGIKAEIAKYGLMPENITKSGRGYNVKIGQYEYVVKEVIDPATGMITWDWTPMDLPFANGGILRKMSSVYGNDMVAIRNAITNARQRQKK